MNPSDENWPYPFSPADWQACLRVLQATLTEPDQVPDLETFKTLVSGTYKQARKQKRKQSLNERQEHDQAVIASTERVQQELAATGPTPPNLALFQAKYCYSCKSQYHQVDHYYHRLCPACAALNKTHREFKLDLSGRIALVTGGRIKIGYATALRLLRSQAQVWVTSRFPAQAAACFAQEPDFENWRQNLKILGLDLLNLGGLEDFIQYLYQVMPHLDILINNAALTLWQPPIFYQTLREQENLLEPQFKDLGLILNGPLSAAALQVQSETLESNRNSFTRTSANGFNLPQIIPANDHNSWRLELEQIPAREMLEVQVINQIAPMMLCSQLKGLMLCSPFEQRWIINVTAVEGQFSDPLKQSKHAHTNAAKAGLNMLTRTAAAAYAQAGILMNAVDPGWVSSDQHAAKHAVSGIEAHKVPPLDLDDASARLCAPIYDSLQGQPIWGKLLKNYQIVDW
jgi:NAD(P)-dependent dehydrogenase (short-subunit alcohol dehydrogenase family)